jgi:hypothetical protein
MMFQWVQAYMVLAIYWFFVRLRSIILRRWTKLNRLSVSFSFQKHAQSRDISVNFVSETQTRRSQSFLFLELAELLGA